MNPVNSETPWARGKNPCHMKAAFAFALLAIVPLAQAEQFEVYPTEIHLTTSRAEQSIVSRVVQPAAITRDVTDQVQWIVPDSRIAKMEGHVIRPLADGTGKLLVKYHDQAVPVSLTVKDAKIDPPIS